MTRPIRLLVPLLALVFLAACDQEKTCETDQTLCSDRCTSLVTDRANCGACGQVCGAGYDCAAGACTCPGGRTVCAGAGGSVCADLASDPQNCGACGNGCSGGMVCTPTGGGTSACAVACTGGLEGCGNACVDRATNRDHCGACGRSCGSGEQCAAGRCVADLYLACFNSNEVREATAALAPAGLPLAVAKGPMGLAWAGDRLAVISGASGGAETLSMVDFDPPAIRQSQVWTTSSAHPDVEYVAEHRGLLYVAHNSAGTLVVVTPTGQVVDEIGLVASGAGNPNPQGIAFDGADRAYVALEATGEVLVLDVSQVTSCAAGTASPPCTSELARVDLHAAASPGAEPRPVRIAVDGQRAFVALWNLDAYFGLTPGNTGRVGVVRTDTLAVDAAFAGTTSGAIDLGAGCLNAADVAVHAGTLWVSCGAFDYSRWPDVAVLGNGLLPVDVSGSAPIVRPVVAPSADPVHPWAPGKLAFCGATGYVGDRNLGRVVAFDPAAVTTLGAGVELCPQSNGFAYVADIACGR